MIIKLPVISEKKIKDLITDEKKALTDRRKFSEDELSEILKDVKDIILEKYLNSTDLNSLNKKVLRADALKEFKSNLELRIKDTLSRLYI